MSQPITLTKVHEALKKDLSNVGSLTFILRKKKQQRIIAFLMLSLMTVMSPWLSFWTSPILLSQNTNQYLFVCTINGIEKLDISPPGYQYQDIVEHCSALQLADLLSHTTPTHFEQNKLQKLPSINRHTLSFYHHTVPHISSYTSRAPPNISIQII